MHKEQARLLGEHMAVHGRDLDTIASECLDHCIHLRAQQDKVSGNCRLPASVGWKLIAVATPMEGGRVMPESVICSARGTLNCRMPPFTLPLCPSACSTCFCSKPNSGAVCDGAAESGPGVLVRASASWIAPAIWTGSP